MGIGGPWTLERGFEIPSSPEPSLKRVIARESCSVQREAKGKIEVEKK